MPSRICPCGYRVAKGDKCACQVRNARARVAAADSRRPSAAQRGYDADWRACRAKFLAAYPACIECGGHATEVDHIVSVRQRPDLRLSWSNLRPMCKPHHSARTARDQAFGRNR